MIALPKYRRLAPENDSILGLFGRLKYLGAPYLTLCRLNEAGRQLLTIELMIQALFLPGCNLLTLTTPVQDLYSAGNQTFFTPILTSLQIE